jgi:hypothetical protein
MLLENVVFAVQENLPTFAQWQHRIVELGHDLIFTLEFDLRNFEGPLPCLYKGKECSFELVCDEVDVDELIDEGLFSDEQADGLGARSFLITLTAQAGYCDFIAAFIAGGVLAELADGKFLPAGEFPLLDGGQSLLYIEEHLPELLESMGPV